MEALRYKITNQLHTGRKYVIYRALRRDDGSTVILKTLQSPYPSAQALNRLKTEFAILQRFTTARLIRALALENYENRLVLVREDFPGVSLAEHLDHKPVGLEDFFKFALPLAEAVEALHQQRIIHKNLNPQNVLVHPESGEVKLIGFGLAAEMAREALRANAPEAFEASLPYISPEQTGRMNRALDHRTDLYSLGVLFYEMLAGEPPFVTADPLELVHCHIARPPRPPQELRPELPALLSAMVLKLLAKSAEDRYQSASGLRFDLLRCRDLAQAAAPIPAFALGEKDVSDQFRIPEKLYGRAAEVDRLMQAFHRANGGRAELLLVAGYSGVGKSRLVNEVQKSIVQRNGYFITGKFDQFKREAPFSALLSALRELVRQLLSESEERVAQWRGKILEAFGAAGQVIIDVVPEVELLTGPQPAVPELPPLESRNRFNQVFDRFVRVFCQPQHPLCIFLDDLQWLDSSTRQWLETQLADQSLNNLLLIGAYRDNEVSASHPLMLMLDRLRQTGAIVNTINLQPLDVPALNAMVADTLATTPENCADLAAVVYSKTNGNPFFARQCLLALHEGGAIRFVPEKQAWGYDLASARQAQISDNVLELMSTLIKRLPHDVQHTLTFAACIGSRFDLRTLSIVSEQDIEAIRAQMETAVQQGLVMPFRSWTLEDAEEYYFLHDRVQQAALSFLSEAEMQAVRLQIGRLLLASSANIETDEKLFDAADHLNFAGALITADQEKQKLVAVNLAAGIRAKNSAAYETGLRYVTQAMDLVPAAAWKTPSTLTMELLLQRADCEHLCGHDDLAEQYYDQALRHASTELERARVYQRKIHYYINLAKFAEAYQTGREAVRPLGVNLPAKFIPPLFVKDMALARLLLGRRKISELVNLPEMTDERLQTAVRLISTFARAAYQIRPELCIAVCAKMVNLCIQHGNTEGGYIGYMAFGAIFLGAVLNRKQTGYDFGELTLALVDKYKSQMYKAEAHFVVGYFAVPWRRPAVEMERYWQIAYEAGIGAGDLFHASCACSGTIQSYYMRGLPFDEVWSASERYLEFLRRINSREAIGTINAVRQSIRNLRGETIARDSYSDGEFDEAAYVRELANFGSRHFAHYYFINKMQTLYLWGEYEKAHAVAQESARYLKDSLGMLHTAEHHFYHGLILCALSPQAGAQQRRAWNKTLRKIHRDFQKYAAGCPANFVHKAQLLEAEIARVRGEVAKAETLYNAAIESAAEYGYLNIQALANDLAARCLYAAGRRRVAAFHLREAEYAYTRWGATAYAEFLPTRFSTLFEHAVESPAASTGPGQMKLAATEESTLDLTTVLKSSEAISGQIRLRDLLTSLMNIITENAGAQRSLLFLLQNDQLLMQGERLVESDVVRVLDGTPLDAYPRVSKSVINYVARTQEPVILDDAAVTGSFTNDPYIREHKLRSVLCAPLMRHGKLTGIIYLENNLANAAFTRDRIALLNLLSGQMAISIENALLYDNLEEKVIERTEELRNKNLELESTLQTLKETQRQLIHAEKMASLGQMASGIAHEIQNPLNFVNNFAAFSEELLAELKEGLTAQQDRKVAEISPELEGTFKDLQTYTAKITEHGKRAENIVKGMMAHAAASTGQRQPVKLHTLLDQSIERAQRIFATTAPDFPVTFHKAYDPAIDTLTVLPENLAQVFANLIDNALYATREKKQKQGANYQPEISISSTSNAEKVEIRIRDNGAGIPPEHIDKIFVPFFTTKPTGRGNTGLGLSVSHQIIVDGHNGAIDVASRQGEFTEFTIVLPRR